MKPFDLKTWQDNPGIKVVTRRGEAVTGLTYFPNRTTYNLIGVTESDQYPFTWTELGRVIKGFENTEDLMFASDPQPKLRPWKSEEVPMPVCWIRNKKESTVTLVVQCNNFCVDTVGNTIRYKDLLEEYEHSTDCKTWKHCGVVI